MEQNASIKSPFQMRDWRIVHLNYGNPFFDTDPNSEVQWELEVSKSIEPSEDQQYYTGTLCHTNKGIDTISLGKDG